MADYDVVKYLGSGAFGKVLEVRRSQAETASMRMIVNARNAGFGEENAEIVRFEGECDGARLYGCECARLLHAIWCESRLDLGEKRHAGAKKFQNLR
jgi:hypothetical protein